MRNGQIRKKMSCRLAIMLVWGILLCFLCACGGADSGSAENAATVDLGSTDLTYTGDHVSGILCEGVEVDADIPDLSNVTSYDIVRACMQLPDDDVIESMKAYVFDECLEDEILYTPMPEDCLDVYYVEGDPEQNDRNFRICSAPGYQGIFFYNFEAYPYERITYTKTLSPENNIACYSFIEQKDLSFMQMKTAIETVVEQLNEWNIFPVDNPSVFCMDSEGVYNVLTEWYEVGLAINPIEETSKDELECYLMIFEVGYNNIPYTFYEFGSELAGTFTNQASLEVYFTEKGIVNFEYECADYEIEKIIERHDSVITLDQAMSQVRTQYEEIVTMSGIYISKIYFQYIPTDPDSETGECTLVPSWVIQPSTYITTGEEESETYLDVIVVNAITGEIMM